MLQKTTILGVCIHGGVFAMTAPDGTRMQIKAESPCACVLSGSTLLEVAPMKPAAPEPQRSPWSPRLRVASFAKTAPAVRWS